MLHAEVRNREILSEEFPVVAPGVFSNNVGVVVFDGEEELCCVELRFVVLVCLNLSGADRCVSSVLDDVLVSSPDVAVFPECPWPSVEVDGLVVNGICSGDGGLVVNCNVDWEGSEGTKKGPCDFRSS